MMKKKFILLLAILSVSLTACNDKQSGGDTSQAIDNSKTYNWKMVTTWPPGFPVLQEGAERFAQNIKDMSNGRLEIKVYAGGELIPPLQTFDAVSQGTVEMGHGSAYYWAGKVPEAQFFSTVPFGMTARGMNAWLYDGGGLELWREVYQPFHVIPFPLGNTGVQMGGWFNKEINSLEDIKGLKMRIPGLGGKVFAKAGGNPVLLAGSEVYTALERNTIDATEWIGPFHDQRLGLYRAAEYYYYPGWHEPGTVLELTINQRAWDSLPIDLQAIVTNAAMAENMRMLSEMEQKNLSALQELKDRPKVQIHRFPDDVLTKLKTLTDETLAEESANNPEFKRIYEAYQTFREQNDAWSDISENAYLAIKNEMIMYLVFTPEGFEEIKTSLIDDKATLWINKSAISDEQLAELTAAHITVHILADDIDPADETSLFTTIEMIENDNPDTKLFVEYL